MSKRHSSTRTCLIVGILVFVLAACLLGSLCGAGGLAWRLAARPTLTPISTLPPTPIPTPTRAPTPLPFHTPTSLPTRTPTPLLPRTPPPTDEATARHLRIFTDLWELVRDEYLYPDYNGVDWEAVGRTYRARIEDGLSDESFWLLMDDMLFELDDEHSIFLSPEEAAEEDEARAGELDYVGIGVYSVSLPDKGYAAVLLVFPGSPAARAGIRPHDRILQADGLPVCCDADGGDYMDLVFGPEGSKVELRVQTPGELPRDVAVTRARIQAALPVERRRLADGVGYVLIPTLWDDTVVERVRGALEELAAAGELSGLVLDMRVNAGGSDTALEGLLALFVDGELGHFVGPHWEEPLRVDGVDVGGSQRVPLAILVGTETASFAEVFGGVLREAGRARIVGRTTLGNVEIVYGYDFEDGSRAWIAQETFRPPSGVDWEQTGIVPDVEVPLDWDEFTAEDDPQLDAALELLGSETGY